ncbi:histidine kinase [Bifidobacterium sp. DSM 109958]|uniref:Histidine kinase n=1 Tax=Bifidobacterium moraviense TaxID=2675323 RepID=A0A7Y0HZ24_9BIFI|nr:histidine kinase [Bifidobacterium sp. DSM 109958]NMM99769.1 histidine kinase [Bifidobacterium sp. DSM 109958]
MTHDAITRGTPPHAAGGRPSGEGTLRRLTRRATTWIVRTAYANRWHAALGAAGALWELWRILADPLRAYHFHYEPYLTSLAAAFGLLLAAGFALAPEYAAYGTMAVCLAWVGLATGADTLPWMVVGVAAATGALARVRPRRGVIATGVWLAALAAVAAWRAGGMRSPSGFVDACATLGLCAAVACYVGVSVGWRLQAGAMADAQASRVRAEQELTRKRRSDAIARSIHDSLTGNLSYIALLAQRELSRLETDDDRGDEGDGRAAAHETWLSVERNANDALRGVRRVIGLLESDDAGNAGVPGAERSFEGIMRAQEPKLDALGIHGRTVVIDRSDGAVSPERLEAAHALVEELYANLMRHCATGDDVYFLRVAADGEGVTIAEANAPRARGNAGAGLPESGTGLVRHARAIRRLGGTCDWREDDGEWLFSAFIPAAATPSASSAPSSVG